MNVLGSNHTDCAILIYDDAGSHLGTSTVIEHDRNSARIEVRDIPAALKVGNTCKILILSSPAPCEYDGRIISEGQKRYIAMFHGKEKENRAAARYKISTPAIIENLIYNGKAFPLHTPMDVMIVNISKSGVRIRAPYYSFLNGDRFQLRMKISDAEKLLIADIVHHVDFEPSSSEYGCSFLTGSERR